MSGRSSASTLSLSITAQTGRDFAPFLKKRMAQAFTLVQPKSRTAALREFSLVLVGDERMSELHEEFLSIAGPTDVLTFPIDEDLRGKVTSGEVIVCVPEARRQARERGTAPRLEVLLYAIHGMLHLLGYDDRTASGYRIMHRTEDELLTRMGLGNVFAKPAVFAKPVAVAKPAALARGRSARRRSTASHTRGGAR